MCSREEVVQSILSAKTLREAIGIFCEHRVLLKGCRFLFFRDLEFPMPPIVNCKYPKDGSEQGYAIYALSCSDHLAILDEKRIAEMMNGQSSTICGGVCINFDTQILTDLKAYYEDKTQSSKSLIDLMADLEKCKCDYTCLPYLLENGDKLPDPRIWAGMFKSLKVYFHYKENTWHDFGLNLPFSNQTYIQTHKILESIQSEVYARGIADLIAMKKAIHCTLLKCAIITLRHRTRSAEKKMQRLLEFVNNQLGTALDRELVLCYLHFQNDNSVKKFFKKIQPNVKNPREVVRGMAWDLWHLRMLEFSTAWDTFESDQFFVHALLTHDFGLQEVIKKVPLQCLAIAEKNEDGIPIYMSRYEPSLEEVLKDNINIMHEFAAKEPIREITRQRVDYEKLIQSLENELCG